MFVLYHYRDYTVRAEGSETNSAHQWMQDLSNFFYWDTPTNVMKLLYIAVSQLGATGLFGNSDWLPLSEPFGNVGTR
jgi:hypothetical protein